ncbi:MAG TPA: nuclear transport factor 2 family protein [Armatimonadota bacterium]|jgi:ketosteroid isomerase-like protein
MSTEDEVRNASELFYAALNSMVNGDATPLAGIWSHSASVSAMHPIGGRHVGWDQVRGSFEQVGRIASQGKVGLEDQILQVAGDAAWEVGIERGQAMMAGHHVDIDQRVTNIYRREGGVWKIVHHHTDVSPAMLGVVSGL